MLRHKLGDEVFWKGIRTYYEKYRNSNAMTDDFREVMESVSGKDLNAFFEQWIFTKGYPELKWKWSYKGKKLNISIVQLQKHHTYSFPLEIGVTINGKTTINTVEVTDAKANFSIKTDAKPDSVILDPDSWLLFEDKNP